MEVQLLAETLVVRYYSKLAIQGVQIRQVEWLLLLVVLQLGHEVSGAL
jgi:hypothetical protein